MLPVTFLDVNLKGFTVSSSCVLINTEATKLSFVDGLGLNLLFGAVKPILREHPWDTPTVVS